MREERKDDSTRRNDNDGGMMFSLVGHLMHIEQRLPDPTTDQFAITPPVEEYDVIRALLRG